jgi:hypothetical protein
MHQARRDICRGERLRIADDEGGCVEALRDCVALMFAQGEVRPVRSLPAAALLAVEDGFVAVRRTAPAPRRSVIVDEAAAGGVLLPPTAGEELVALVPSCIRVVSSAAIDNLLSGSEGAHVVCEALASALRRREELIASLSNARHVERVRDCSARETVTRAVDELEREGFVIRERGGYRVRVDAQLLV